MLPMLPNTSTVDASTAAFLVALAEHWMLIHSPVAPADRRRQVRHLIVVNLLASIITMVSIKEEASNQLEKLAALISTDIKHKRGETLPRLNFLSCLL